MLPILIQRIAAVLIRRINNALAIRAEGNMVHFELAGRQQCGRSALPRHRVQVCPATALPRKDDFSVRAPPQLARAGGLVENASRTAVCVPHLAALAGLRIRYADRPWLLGFAHPTRGILRHQRLPYERNMLAILRPCRTPVGICTRCQICERFRSQAIHADEAVVVARTHECQRAAIRRPSQIPLLAASLEELLRLGGGIFQAPHVVQIHRPDLSVQQIRDQVTLRRDRSAVSLTDIAWRPAIRGNQPHLLLHPGSQQCRIWRRPLRPLRIAAACVSQPRAVGRPR